MEVKLICRLDIGLADGSPDPAPDDPLADRMRAAAAEAVWNALEKVAGEGFSHDLDTVTSIEPRSVVAVEPVKDAAGDAERALEYLLDAEHQSYLEHVVENGGGQEHIYAVAERGLEHLREWVKPKPFRIPLEGMVIRTPEHGKAFKLLLKLMDDPTNEEVWKEASTFVEKVRNMKMPDIRKILEENKYS